MMDAAAARLQLPAVTGMSTSMSAAVLAGMA